VLLETGGHRSISSVPDGVIKIVDVKCPAAANPTRTTGAISSAVAARRGQVRHRGRGDFDYAADVVRRHRLAGRCAAILFSHRFTACSILERCRNGCSPMASRHALQVQLHKYIWPPSTRGV
jgi:7-carboxy-7-deazaguanine synthase